LKGVTMAGVSGGFVGAADLGVPLDPAALVKIGGMLGAGGIIVHDDSRCMVRAARACMAFFAAESCGKCFPCRIGTTRATEILAGMATGATRPDALRELEDLCNVMGEASACGLGLAAPFVVRSLERYWPDEVRAHLEGRCVAGECERR
ncbi:MAG: NADH-ubiquinone oxidoreductase-F iron-sulfur binding region domain-containing protein, partial [Planctomycetota bacterium]